MKKLDKNKIMSLACPLLFLAFGIWIRVSAVKMAKRDAMFPKIVAWLIIIVSVIDFISEMRKTEHKNRFANSNVLKVAICVVVMFLYVGLMKKIGFYLDTLLLTAFTMWILDYRNYKVLPIAAVIITTVVFAAFKYLLKVPLPTLFL